MNNYNTVDSSMPITLFQLDENVHYNVPVNDNHMSREHRIKRYFLMTVAAGILGWLLF